MPKHLFDFYLINPFVTAIKKAIDWDWDTQPPEKVKRFFPNMRKQRASFPFMEEIRELMDNEWEKPEKKARTQNWFAKLYPFKSSDAAF